MSRQYQNSRYTFATKLRTYILHALIYVHACKNRNDILAKIVKFGLKRPVLHPCFVAVLQTASKPLDLTWPYLMWVKYFWSQITTYYKISKLMTIYFCSFLGKKDNIWCIDDEIFTRNFLWKTCKYCIVPSTNTCYNSENQIFYSLE